jgi:predicted small secreted protein
MRRLVMAVVVAGALLAACGDDEGAGAPQSAAASSGPCGDVVAGFVEQLDDLDARLEIGMTLGDFEGAFRELERIAEAFTGPSPAQMDDRCKEEVLEPALAALDAYERGSQLWTSCEECSARELAKNLSVLWAEASLSLRGLAEELGLSPAPAPAWLCEPVVQGRDLLAGLEDGSMSTGEGGAQAQDLVNDFLEAEDRLEAEGPEHLLDEVILTQGALSNLSTTFGEPDELEALEFALEEFGCPDEEDPTPLV